MDPIYLFHLTPVAMMTTVLIINHRINGRRNQRRNALEASRLATALATELQAMQQHYTDNLDLLSQEAPILLASRGGWQVYRSNVGRMVTLLDERVIGQVVGAYANHDRIDALLTACSQPNSHNTLRAGAGGAYHDRLVQAYRNGCEVVEGALSALALAWPMRGAAEEGEDAPSVASTDVALVSVGAGQVE